MYVQMNMVGQVVYRRVFFYKVVVENDIFYFENVLLDGNFDFEVNFKDKNGNIVLYCFLNFNIFIDLEEVK